MNDKIIRVLINEDDAADAELELRELRRTDPRIWHRIVNNEESFRSALSEITPDLILSDFSVPGFDGRKALSVARDICPGTPFIFVSGAIGEETAIDLLKRGAVDYVLKTNLIRLGPAVTRALQNVAERHARPCRTLLSELALRGELRNFSRNEMLIIEGAASDSLYILMVGQLKVFTRDDKGRELIYGILEPGEFFGEMFLDGGARSASVKANVESQCAVIHHSVVRSFMSSYPEFAECLMMKLTERLRHATQQIKSLGLNDVYQRTITLLNEVALYEEGVRVIPTTLTQQEIADRVGATREMVNHILGDLIRGGFLSKEKNRRMVIIKDLPKHW
jgi:CRP/FNR family cyclic AMP-dependent transcriptional regulator